MQITRLAGNMLTGNRSMFLDIDGSVVWLYQCPNFLLPLRVLDNCYDRISILFERTTNFYILSPVKIMFSHPRKPVWMVTVIFQL